MFKKLSLILGILAISAGTLFAEGTKVVVLDIARVVDTFSKTKAVKDEVEQDGKYVEETQKIKVDEFKKLEEKFNNAVKNLNAARSNPTLSKPAVDKAQAEVEKLYREVAQAQQNLQRSIQENREFLQNRLVQKTNVILQEDILPRIKEIAKAHGAEIVLNPRSGIIFFEPNADITEELLARLEKDFPAEKEAADGKTTPEETAK